jgi:DNA-binding NarL/FixJ family response regulator
VQAIGALRYATEAAAHAASAFLAGGRQDAARRAAARCHQLYEAGEGGIVTVIEGLEPGATALTSRERQLVDLAARGLSNAEIADRLVLSVRTVESHLYRAMHKLGVTNRQQLPAPPRPPGPRPPLTSRAKDSPPGAAAVNPRRQRGCRPVSSGRVR